MLPRILITIIFSTVLFSPSSTTLSSSSSQLEESESTDIHDLLPKYGLPRGLIPDGVVSLSLSPDGFFRLQLPPHCYVNLDLILFYNTEFTGKLADGSVSEVTGIQVKELFLWVSVTGIKVNRNGTLQFFVGPLAKTLSAEQFQDVPKCSSRVAPLTLPNLVGTFLN